MSKPTPGPWFVAPNENADPVGDFEINSECGFYIAETIGGHNHGIEEANARLIAAAPELLEACIAMSQWGDGNVNLHTRLTLFDVAIKKIRAAIAKAEGKQ